MELHSEGGGGNGEAVVSEGTARSQSPAPWWAASRRFARAEAKVGGIFVARAGRGMKWLRMREKAGWSAARRGMGREATSERGARGRDEA